MLQCVAVCCSVLQCVSECDSLLGGDFIYSELLTMSIVLQYLQYVAVCCGVLQGVTVCGGEISFIASC